MSERSGTRGRQGWVRVLLTCLLLSACRVSGAEQSGVRRPGERKPSGVALAEPLYQGGVAAGWRDFGWCSKRLPPGQPAELELAGYGGWILARPERGAVHVGGLLLRFRAPVEYGDFLEVRLDSGGAEVFPRVAVGAGHRADLPDGWSEVWLSMAELNPRDRPFDRVVMRARRELPAPGMVLLEGLGFTREAPPGAPAPGGGAVAATGEAAGRPAVSRPVRMSVECRAAGHPINPMVYGIAYDARQDAGHAQQWQVGATARRWGGNPTSRYNWELGNAWNTASDWFWRNVNSTRREDFTYDHFLQDNLTRGMKTALTIPTLGWVARDTRSASFPVAQFGRQQQTDPSFPQYGNGLDPEGKPLTPGPATRTSVPASPEMMGRWVRAIRARDRERGVRSVHQYILDNEPMLWHDTHRDVHPEPVGYDELLERSIAYGSAIRKEDPEAVIAGPALWGWPAYFYSAKDAVAGFRLAPDRRAHGDVPLLPWYLGKLAEHERRTGVRVLDVVDVHFYPQGKGIRRGNTGGATDPDTAARRIRSVRALWDPAYTDESWIQEPVRLLPRLREWIAQHAPGRGISIGEYHFGAEEHMSGGLAVAEALGRFGEAGIDSAFYWTYPGQDSPAFWAFRAYRNYDGSGARFESHHVPARSSDGLAPLFVARDASGGTLTAVLLNQDPGRDAEAALALEGCGEVVGQRRFVFRGERTGLAAQAPAAQKAGGPLQVSLPAYSITVLELQTRAQARASTTPP